MVRSEGTIEKGARKIRCLYKKGKEYNRQLDAEVLRFGVLALFILGPARYVG